MVKKMVWAAVLLLCFSVLLISFCTPGGLAPKYVYQNFAWHYVGSLRGDSVAPILPPVKRITFYELKGDNIWPEPKDFNRLRKAYETSDQEEIAFLLSIFKEDLPDTFPWGERTGGYFGMEIVFSTLETLYVPFELYENFAMLYLVDYCTEIYGHPSANIFEFLKEKDIASASAD